MFPPTPEATVPSSPTQTRKRSPLFWPLVLIVILGVVLIAQVVHRTMEPNALRDAEAKRIVTVRAIEASLKRQGFIATDVSTDGMGDVPSPLPASVLFQNYTAMFSAHFASCGSQQYHLVFDGKDYRPFDTYAQYGIPNKQGTFILTPADVDRKGC